MLDSIVPPQDRSTSLLSASVHRPTLPPIPAPHGTTTASASPSSVSATRLCPPARPCRSPRPAPRHHDVRCSRSILQRLGVHQPSTTCTAATRFASAERNRAGADGTVRRHRSRRRQGARATPFDDLGGRRALGRRSSLRPPPRRGPAFDRPPLAGPSTTGVLAKRRTAAHIDRNMIEDARWHVPTGCRSRNTGPGSTAPRGQSSDPSLLTGTARSLGLGHIGQRRGPDRPEPSSTCRPSSAALTSTPRTHSRNSGFPQQFHDPHDFCVR